jgi:thioredoxin-dependent peroxiredoxin
MAKSSGSKKAKKAVKRTVKKITPKSTTKNSRPAKSKTQTMLDGMPREGQLAPDFTLPDQHGHAVTLSKLRGTKVVLYFYPKDDTPGCTIEAQSFKEKIKEFQKRGVVVLGVSKDDLKSHCSFIDKYGLNFQLLSDQDTLVIRRYGAWVQKMNYGKPYMGTQRATFLIDENGRIAKAWPKVTPEGHADEILSILTSKLNIL